MIHQSKSQYYLGPSQTSMVEFFTEIFGCKPLIVFLKISNLDMTGSIRCFQKHFLFFVSEDFASWKKHVISTPVGLSLLFQDQMGLIKRGLDGQVGACNRNW